MDGAISQYKCHISAQYEKEDDIPALEDAVYCLLTAYKNCNQSQLPVRIIVYRDGVSESQFEAVTKKEIKQVKNALMRHGDVDTIKLAFIVAQKRHNTRLFYKDDSSSGSGTYLNSCPGVCVDGGGQSRSITSARYNEFLLASHVAIQGTSKPCKYTLLYDEIGLKMSELELLTYWSTYMYGRCNKSVSYATPGE